MRRPHQSSIGPQRSGRGPALRYVRYSVGMTDRADRAAIVSKASPGSRNPIALRIAVGPGLVSIHPSHIRVDHAIDAVRDEGAPGLRRGAPLIRFGTPRIEAGTRRPAPARSRGRARDWAFAGITSLALIAVADPMVARSATTPPAARSLLASWASTHSVTTYPETSQRISFRATWTTAVRAGYLGGRVRASNQRGARATIMFTGTGISWIGPIGPTRGSARIYLDGRLVRTVDTHATRFSPARALFTMTFASMRPRTLEIVVAGTAGHPTVAIDAIAVRTKPIAAAVFAGDATGATDVTAALRTFLQSHNGQRVALATNGIYKVTQLSFTASGLTVDFRGARIEGSLVGAYGILRVQTSTNIVLNDPHVVGTGYIYTASTQWEHGIHVDGGSNITINNPVIRNTRGDGILIGYDPGRNLPPTGVVINNPNIERAARNGIAPVGGEVTIRGGHIAYVGLHGIDFEPNDAIEAASIRGVVDGVDIRRYGDLPAVGYPGYAISAGWGYLSTTKPSLLIQNNTGAVLSIVVMNTGTVRVLNNTSDAAAIAEIITSTNVTFSGNVRITRQ